MNNLKSNKMGEKNIKSLILVMSLPAIVSMTVQSLYNVVDSIFISRYSYDGQTALSYAFPMQMAMLAFAFGIGVGTKVLVARRLGEKNAILAGITANTGIRLAALCGLIFFILGLFIPRIFMSLFTDNVTVVEFGTIYLTIIFMGSLPFFLEVTASRTIQATSTMIVPMIAQIIGATTNIILDPIFIFNLNLGIRGAAYATIIGQSIAFTFTMLTFVYKKYDFKYTFRNYSFNRSVAKDIVLLGLPITASNIVASLTIVFLNSILKNYSYAAVNVLGIYYKLQSFIFMPVFGLTQGLLPIISYNYGAKNYKRYVEAIRFASLIAVSIITMGMIIFQFFPSQLIYMFNDNLENQAIGVIAMRLISLGFIPAVLCILMSVIFQSFSQGFKSLIMILTRQFIILVPLVIILGTLFGINYLWLSFVFSETLCFLIFAPFVIRTIKIKFANKEKITTV